MGSKRKNMLNEADKCNNGSNHETHKERISWNERMEIEGKDSKRGQSRG